MRLLIIDVDQSIVEVIEDGCTGLPNLQLAVAGSRDTALALVTNCDFDLVVCDLRLPTSEGAIDADTAHGLQVFTELRSRCPGTPILILSAYGTLDIVSDFLAQGHRDDPFGLGQSQPMITFMTKAKIRECVEEIRLAAFAKANLAAVTIAGSAEPGLSTSERSVVQLYARKSGGVTVSA